MRLNVWIFAAVSFALLAGCKKDNVQDEPIKHTHQQREKAMHEHHDHGKAHSTGSVHEGHKHNFKEPEKYAASWNDPARDGWQKPDEIIAAMRITPGARVADIGAGTGYLTSPLADAVGPEGEVFALDIEEKMVEYLSDAMRDVPQVSPKLAMPDDPTMEPASLDAVVTLNTWHHIFERVAYAGKVKASLKPGGSFVVVDFIKEDTPEWGPPMQMRLSAAQVVEELERAGFANVEILDETLPRHYIVRASVSP